MRTLISCLALCFLALGLNAQDEEPYVKLEEAKGSSHGQAHGETVVQYYGYYLKDIFGNLDQAYAFEIDNKALRKKKFNLDVLGDLSNKDWIIEEVNKLLMEEGYEVEKTRRHPRIYGLTYPNPQNCDMSGGTVSSESQINKDWTGECVKLERVVAKLREWHPNLLIQIPAEIQVPKVKLEKSTVKDLISQLESYGLKLEMQEELSARSYITVYR